MGPYNPVMFVSAFLLAAAASEAVPAPVDAIPSGACILELRRARIEVMAGHDAQAREILESSTGGACREEVLPLIGLVRILRDGKAPEEEIEAARSRLSRRLQDESVPLPLTFLEFLLDGRTAPDELKAISDAVGRRLARTPDDVKLLDAHTVLLLRLDRLPEARAALARRISLRDDVDAETRMVDLDIRMKNFEDAYTRYRTRVLTESPDLPYVRMTVAHLAILADHPGDAVDLVTPLLSSPMWKSQAASLVLLPAAWRYHDDGKPDEARRALLAARSAAPGLVEAQRMYLQFYASDEERAAAREALDAAWAKKDNPFDLLTEGAKRLAAGSAEDAFPLLEAAANGLPDSDVAWYNLGLAAQKLERWADAERAFARATTLKPDGVPAWASLGYARLKLERWAPAIDALETAVRLDPKHKLARLNLAYCYEKLGNDAKAKAQRDAAAGLGPS